MRRQLRGFKQVLPSVENSTGKHLWRKENKQQKVKCILIYFVELLTQLEIANIGTSFKTNSKA